MLIVIAVISTCAALLVSAQAATTNWTDSAINPFITPTSLNVISQVHCNDLSSAFEHSTISAITCSNGSILNWSKFVDNPFISMSFGSVRADGAVKLGGLQRPESLQLPTGYQLYPIEGTKGVLLVDDGLPGNGVADAAYYPDILTKINWTDFSLPPPTTTEKFSDDQLYLKMYPYGLSVSNNRQWLVGYSTAYGYIRMNLTTKQYHSFGGGYNVDYGRRRVAVIANSTITDDGSIVALGDNTINTSGGLRLYSFDTTRLPCRLVTDRYLTDCPARSLTSYMTRQIVNFRGIRSVHFNDETHLDIEVTINTGSSSQFNRYRISLEPPQKGTDTYIALGDSIASGEGAHYYRSGTDVAGGNKCHTSMASYPYILRPQAQSVACSGAKVADINGTAWGQRTGRSRTSYSMAEIDQLLQQFMPGNLNQLEFVKKYQPSAVTITVGGNDLGFATLLKSCIDPRRSFRGDGCFPTFEDRQEILQTIQSQYDTLTQLYRTLQKVSPSSRFYVVGYPQLVSDAGRCGLNVQLGQDERQSIIAMTTAFNTIIKQAAVNNGLFYVDVAEAFVGHKLCEAGQAAVNGITAGDDSLVLAGRPVLGQEGFHPTAYGHTLLASIINAQTVGLTIAMPVTKAVPPSGESAGELWRDQADRSGRAIGERQIVTMDAEQSDSGSTIKYSDQANLLDPIQPAQFKIDDKAIAASYSNGSWQTPVGSSLPDGTYTVELHGLDRFGRPITLMSTVESASSTGSLQINSGRITTRYGP